MVEQPDARPIDYAQATPEVGRRIMDKAVQIVVDFIVEFEKIQL